MTRSLLVTPSPHAHGAATTQRIMWTVSAALLPAALWSVYLFGWRAVQVLVATPVFCALFEWLAARIARRPNSLADGSAVLTGLILAMTLPAGLPVWICAVGAFVAIVMAKAVFGGLGQNPFNPAMTARVFLLIAFPGPLTKWIVPAGTGDAFLGHAVTKLDHAGHLVTSASQAVDAVTAATPLGLLAEQGADALRALSTVDHLLIGRVNGSLGETSALLLLLGGAFLLWRRIITWHIPVSFMAAVAAVAAVAHLVAPDTTMGPVFHVLSGGVLLGAWFMATDYVTSPMFPKGQLLFGAGCGVLTMVIRLWASYPEGVSFAVLLMNALVPLIDRATRPAPFGAAPAKGGR